MNRLSDRDSLESTDQDNAPASMEGAAATLSNSLRGMAASMARVLASLNLVGSLSLLAAIVSFWIDFRGSYAATKDALSPVAAGLLPPVLIGVTVFVLVWFVVYGWRYIQSLRAQVAPELETRAGLKKLVPDIESCLFFLGEVDQASGNKRDRLIHYIGETGLSLWEDLQTIGLDGPTAYCIQTALPDFEGEEPDVEQLRRVLTVLAPLARTGKVKEARRIY